MGQPVRKNIKEAHPDLIPKEIPPRTLLIDGGSLLFMSFADPTLNSDGVHIGAVHQFLLQMKLMMEKYNPDYVYVFFDSEFSGYMRYELYKPYKANRDKHYEDYGMSDYWKAFNNKVRDIRANTWGNKKYKKEESEKEKFIKENFDREQLLLMKYFEELFVRCYVDDKVEGDDLISYYCKNKLPDEKIIIMTSDMDLMQLLSDTISVYDLKKKVFITTKNFYKHFGYHYSNVLTKKIFCGDDSDNIGNIRGLSEDRFFSLMPEAKEKHISIEDVKNKAKALIDERIANKKKPLKLHENIINGVCNKTYDGDFYEINEKIIDLTNPLISEEAKEAMDAMMHTPIDPKGRSFKNLYEYITDDGIDTLRGSTKFSTFFTPFKILEEKEKKRYFTSVS